MPAAGWQGVVRREDTAPTPRGSGARGDRARPKNRRAGQLARYPTSAMSRSGLWRVLILCATLFCVAMLFAPLVDEVFERLAEDPEIIP